VISSRYTRAYNPHPGWGKIPPPSRSTILGFDSSMGAYLVSILRRVQ